MCILIWNILLRNWLCTGIKTNRNANEYGRMKRTHGTSSYRTDRIQRSHTFIGVMPIVASCWQNEFPRNLFALKTCDNEKQKRKHERAKESSACPRARTHTGPMCSSQTFVFFAEFLIYYQRSLSWYSAFDRHAHTRQNTMEKLWNCCNVKLKPLTAW